MVGWIHSWAQLPGGSAPKDPVPQQFIEFLDLLTAEAPEGYSPWLFRVKKGSKAPDTSFRSWKDEAARLDRDEAIQWMQQGGNVGIAARGACPDCHPDKDDKKDPAECSHRGQADDRQGFADALVNVDIDDEDETAPDDLKTTLTAKSRSRTGRHAWYFEAADSDIPNIPTDEAGEVRSQWQYVVAPGSYVETDPEEVPEAERGNAGYYTISTPAPATTIEYDELPAVFQSADQPDSPKLDNNAQAHLSQNPDLDQGEQSADETAGSGAAGSADDSDSALFNVTARDVAQREAGVRSTTDRWASIFHGSKTGENMSLSDEGMLHCWRHGVTHNGLQALCTLSDYRGDCEQVGSPHSGSGAGASCLKSDDGEHIWHAWKYAKKNSYIPEDDPVPYSALKYLCRARDLCAVSSLPDGGEGSIPAAGYDAALSTIQNKDGLDPGRVKTDEIDSGDRDRPADPADVIDQAADGGGSGADSPDDEADKGYTDSRGLYHDPGEGVLLRRNIETLADLSEDQSISDLTDREKAACVWQLIKETDRVHIRLRTDDGTLWGYDSGVWTRSGERQLTEAARQALSPMQFGENIVREIQTQARGDPTAHISADEFGVPDQTVAVGNGLLDIRAAAEGRTDEALRDLDPDDYALARLPVRYDPEAECDRWKQFVGEVVEPARIETVKKYAGYCLHRSGLPFHKALLLVGSGKNGKSTFLGVIRSLLGEQHTTSKPVGKFGDENHIAALQGSIANIDADLSAGSLSQSGIANFKRLTGGDAIDAAHKYEDPFSFQPHAKHLYAANQVPDVSKYVEDEDIAFWRRWIVVEFPNYIPKADRDHDLDDRLTTDEALSGILNWAIDGWGQLFADGGFTEADDHDQTRRRWLAWGESADEFVSEHIERDPEADRLTTNEAWECYRAWCKKHGKEAVGQGELTSKIKQAAESVGYSNSVRIGGSPVRGYTSLAFSEDVPAPDRDETDSGADNDSGQTSLDFD